MATPTKTRAAAAHPAKGTTDVAPATASPASNTTAEPIAMVNPPAIVYLPAVESPLLNWRNPLDASENRPNAIAGYPAKRANKLLLKKFITPLPKAMPGTVALNLSMTAFCVARTLTVVAAAAPITPKIDEAKPMVCSGASLFCRL
ncbi:hypothetical protein D3C76_1313180 [compost metagenome]